MAGSIKLAPLLTEIKVDIENFKNDMEKASAIGTSEAKRISKEMETTAKVGKNFSKAGAEFMPISARFIANKASYQFKHAEMDTMLEKLRAELQNKEEAK